jgi:hypothetical protein
MTRHSCRARQVPASFRSPVRPAHSDEPLAPCEPLSSSIPDRLSLTGAQWTKYDKPLFVLRPRHTSSPRTVSADGTD